MIPLLISKNLLTNQHRLIFINDAANKRYPRNPKDFPTGNYINEVISSQTSSPESPEPQSPEPTSRNSLRSFPHNISKHCARLDVKTYAIMMLNIQGFTPNARSTQYWKLDYLINTISCSKLFLPIIALSETGSSLIILTHKFILKITMYLKLIV